MTFILKIAVFSLSATLLTACDDFEQDAALTAEIFASYVAPEGADGNVTPFRAEANITSFLVDFSESPQTDLTGELQNPLSVVDRRQQLFSFDLSDYEEQQISQITIEFASELLLEAPNLSPLLVELEQTTYLIDTSMTVEKGRSEKINIELQWKNTILSQDGSNLSGRAPTIVVGYAP